MITLNKKKAFNNYETTLIIKPEQTEEDTVRIRLIQTYKNTNNSHGASKIFAQNKGRNHLTYLIKKYSDGIYVQINYEANGQIVKKIEKIIRFDEKITRHLTIKNNNYLIKQQASCYI
uniref:ribosomal protein S6 n=1 Tax=Madagascaria erythrocladioides TaxID=753684 RepID=UPI001FCD4970|nr:ribosomal protein S6 [Madagascaria erythrocladioides]UNJ16487.1 ribosomal protein S6 [Madagascaria erythrocladioides]